MNMTTVCKCCGHPLPESNAALGLTRGQQRLFQFVEKAGRAGITRHDLMDRMYANDPNGGPDSLNVLNVQKTNMNRRLLKHGLKITTSRGHYSMWRLEKIALPLGPPYAEAYP
jgi:hypothetical protein